MKKKRIRIVIDTNIWISFLIGKTLAGLDRAIINKSFVILFSEELFDELVEVMRRPKLRRYFPEERIKEFIALLQQRTKIINIKTVITECRDPKDNFLLELCISGKADCLITGDEDLIILNPFRKTKIINYSDFDKILSEMEE